jgi:hypothetical protein
MTLELEKKHDNVKLTWIVDVRLWKHRLGRRSNNAERWRDTMQRFKGRRRSQWRSKKLAGLQAILLIVSIHLVPLLQLHDQLLAKTLKACELRDNHQQVHPAIKADHRSSHNRVHLPVVTRMELRAHQRELIPIASHKAVDIKMVRRMLSSPRGLQMVFKHSSHPVCLDQSTQSSLSMLHQSLVIMVLIMAFSKMML